jgi:hypothetical protein
MIFHTKQGWEVIIMDSVNNVLITTLNGSVATIIAFIPRFLSGFIILLIGIIIATFLRQIVKEALRFIKFESFLKKYGVPESKETADWSTILSEIVRWFTIIVFLVPTAQVWGLGKFVDVLNGLLLYLPNVFISVLMLLVGFVISKLVYELLIASVRGVSRNSTKTIAMLGRWAVLIFVFLIVLNQLGIASDLIRILFAGIVAMIALAGGLAFGLGGRDAARETIEKLKKKL